MEPIQKPESKESGLKFSSITRTAITRDFLRCSRCEFFYLTKTDDVLNKVSISGKLYCSRCKIDIQQERIIRIVNFPYSVHRCDLWVKRYVPHSTAVCCFSKGWSCMIVRCPMKIIMPALGCQAGRVKIWIYLPFPSHRLCMACKSRFEMSSDSCYCPPSVHQYGIHLTNCGCNVNIRDKITSQEVIEL